MSAADKRIAELLDRWLASVELHAQYVELDDEDYARVQHWPEHERPTRWVIELARQRLEELRRHVRSRADAGDESFADALELMSFLTCLLGAEQVERFVPLARPRPIETAVRRQRSQGSEAPPSSAQQPSRKIPTVRPEAKDTPVTAAKQRTPVRPGKARPAAQLQTETPSARPPPPGTPEMTATVIADAVRLLSWGREWPQIAGLVARLANRPAEKEVWEILRQNRASIEAQATRASH